jgi:hypothetical protein
VARSTASTPRFRGTRSRPSTTRAPGTDRRAVQRARPGARVEPRAGLRVDEHAAVDRPQRDRAAPRQRRRPPPHPGARVVRHHPVRLGDRQGVGVACEIAGRVHRGSPVPTSNACSADGLRPVRAGGRRGQVRGQRATHPATEAVVADQTPTATSPPARTTRAAPTARKGADRRSRSSTATPWQPPVARRPRARATRPGTTAGPTGRGCPGSCRRDTRTATCPAPGARRAPGRRARVR